MARKEQQGRQESKSRMAMRQQVRGTPSPKAEEKPVPVRHSKAKERSGCVIVSCTCAHEFQDARYGRQLRVFNLKRPTGATCTVCGAQRSL